MVNNLKGHEHTFTKEDSIKGGLVCSPSKKLAAVFRGLKRKGVTPIQLFVLNALEEKRLDEAAIALIAKQVKGVKNNKELDTAVKNILSMLPKDAIKFDFSQTAIQVNIYQEIKTLRDGLLKVLDKYPKIKKEVLQEWNAQIIKNKKEAEDVKKNINTDRM